MRKLHLSLVCLLMLPAYIYSRPLQASDSLQSKRVLIINSYSRQMEWSRELTDSLLLRLQQLHPSWRVSTGYLKTETAVTSGSAALTLRSLLWNYAIHTNESIDPTKVAQTTLFVQDDIPDALLFIGEEGFAHYATYYRTRGRWTSIPTVLSMVRDSIAWWYPEQGYSRYPYYPADGFRAITQAGDPTVVEGTYDYSGLIYDCSIEQTLRLIHHLLPDLHELIWLGNDSYSSYQSRRAVKELLPGVMPDVRYTEMTHTRQNMDSIYDILLRPVQGRAVLAHGWNMNAYHSRRSETQIDSLLTHVLQVPLFSLTRRNLTGNNYWVGGCYADISQEVSKTIALLEHAVRGEEMNTIPFDTIRNTQIVLNQAALDRFGLQARANSLPGVTYQHPLPGFFQRDHTKSYLTLAIGLTLLAYWIILRRYRRYNHQLHADSARYRELYDKLQIIYDSSHIDFVLYDASGQQIKRMFVAEAPERNNEVEQLFHPNLFAAPYWSDRQRALIRKRRSVSCEVVLGKRQIDRGETETYQVIVTPLNEESYRVASYIAIAVNTTPVVRERNAKERFERLFRFASDSSNIGVVYYDAASATGMATASWEKTLNEQFVSGTFPTYDHVVEEDRIALIKYQHAIRSGSIPPEQFAAEIRVLTNRNEPVWVRHYIYYIPSSNRIIELSLNIDRQKQNEKALEEANRKAEQSNIETQQFLENISHEVRTPLNSIVGFSDILSMMDDEESKAEFKPIILKNVQLLRELIDKILDLSELDAGNVRFDYKPVDVELLFNDMKTYIGNNVYGHELKVVILVPDTPEERTIVTDRNYLEKLLMNLVSNAIKFTEHGSITLRFKREAHIAHFSVIDTGCGMSSEQIDQIYHRFYKANTFVQGTGLGLSLCRSIIDHLGGKMGVTSTPDKGSTFWFDLTMEQS